MRADLSPTLNNFMRCVCVYFQSVQFPKHWTSAVEKQLLLHVGDTQKTCFSLLFSIQFHEIAALHIVLLLWFLHIARPCFVLAKYWACLAFSVLLCVLSSILFVPLCSAQPFIFGKVLLLPQEGLFPLSSLISLERVRGAWLPLMLPFIEQCYVQFWSVCRVFVKKNIIHSISGKKYIKVFFPQGVLIAVDVIISLFCLSVTCIFYHTADCFYYVLVFLKCPFALF